MHLEEIIYFASYVVVDPADTPLEKKQLLSEKEYRAYREKYGTKFQAQWVQKQLNVFLQEIDLRKRNGNLKRRIENSSRATSYSCD